MIQSGEPVVFVGIEGFDVEGIRRALEERGFKLALPPVIPPACGSAAAMTLLRTGCSDHVRRAG